MRWTTVEGAGGNDLCPPERRLSISGLEHVSLEEIQTVSPIPQRPELTEICFVHLLGPMVHWRVSGSPLGDL